ncbi:MAG TPA: YqzL family protein [Patescibacteria group bacterium]|nr:YqzL family protein [Patescibacteria group bacterium]
MWANVLTADFLWRIFEATGSVAAYMLYKRLMLQ